MKNENVKTASELDKMDAEKASEAQSIIEKLLNHAPVETFRNCLDDLQTSFMCFDPAADDSKARNEKVFCVNTLKFILNEVEKYRVKFEPEQ